LNSFIICVGIVALKDVAEVFFYIIKLLLLPIEERHVNDIALISTALFPNLCLDVSSSGISSAEDGGGK
jgi:hypothetical protein